MTNLRPTSTQGEGSADNLSNVKNDLAEAKERIAKAELEKEDLMRKTEDLEMRLVEMRTERDEVEVKAKEGKANETKKLLSSVTKLLLASFPADQVFALDIVLSFELSLNSSNSGIHWPESTGKYKGGHIYIDSFKYNE